MSNLELSKSEVEIVNQVDTKFANGEELSLEELSSYLECFVITEKQ